MLSNILSMDKEVFRSIIKEGQEDIKNVTLYSRPFEFEENGRYVLVGVRQAGKSYMLYQRAKQFMKDGHLLEELVYINFDDERLLGMEAAELDLILQTYYSLYPHKPILFFDEIQNIDGWEHFARRLANQKYKVFITGSNAKMLSRDIATTLGARYFDERIFPYSFSEYLAANDVVLDKEWEYGETKGKVQRLFSEYFYWGGFPELILYKNKRHWLNSLYEKILLGDIVQRNRIKNENAVRLAMKRLAESVKQPLSFNRLANLVKATGVSTTTASIIDYISFAKDACILFSLENYVSKFVEKESVKKHYFVDNGLLNIFLTNPETSLLENLCAIHLYRHYGANLYFYNKNIEVDFYIPDKKMAMQASYSISDIDTFERECGALEKLDAVFGLDLMQIITYNEEKQITLKNGKTIEVIPVWKWLLM